MSAENGASSTDQYELPLLIKDNDYRSSRKPVRPFHNDDIRVMNKKGRINIHLVKIPEKSIRYASDLWNTLVNMRWRWLLLVIALINLAAYSTFGLFFYLDAYLSGDFDNEPGHKMCVKGMGNFTNYFMLSIETLTTTGYGYLYPTEFCYLIFILMTCSTLVMIFIDGAFLSVVYAKFERVTYKTRLFSKRAVISLRNGKLCLMIRINDGQRKHWTDSRVDMYMIETKITPEGDELPNYVTELDVQSHGMLFWPVDVVHVITSSSPLCNISATDLMTTKFEIVAVLSGSCIQTGQLTRTQTSYLSNEIMWGHRFCPCLEYNTAKSEYVVNRKGLNATVPIDTPLCSASTLEKLQKEIDVHGRRNSLDVINPSDETAVRRD